MKPRCIDTIVSVSIFLFFLQAVRVIFSVLFGIIYDQVFEGPMDSWLLFSNLLVVLAFAAPLWAPKNHHKRWVLVFAAIASLARVSLSLNFADVRFWGSLIVVAFGSLYMTARLQLGRRSFIQYMLCSLVMDQLLRVLGNTYDVSLRSSWLYVQILWSIAILAFTWLLYKRSGDLKVEAFGLRLIDGVSLSGFLFLQISLLSLPNAVANWSDIAYVTTTGGRWSDVPYFASATALMGLTLVFCFPSVRDLFLRLFHTSLAGIGLAMLLLLGLLLGYFSKGPLSLLGLLLAHFASLSAFDSAFINSKHPSRDSGGSIALGLILFLALNFMNAFAFTYPYTLPFLRGMGWLVYLTAGLLLSVGAIVQLKPVDLPIPQEVRFIPVGILAICAFAITLVSAWPRAFAPVRAIDRGMRIATYNIHYGYDDLWHFTLDDMARTITEAKADVVVMQEVDSGRITSYGVDDALFLARRLDMNYVYLPTVEHLTGIAVLYRGPMMPSEQQWLSSLQEQTGIIHVNLEFDDKPVNVYGVWMGLSDEDTQTQIAEALNFIGDSPNAVFGGDFNAEYPEPVPQAILAAGFEDPFVVLGIKPPPATSPAIDPQSRIDFVWVRDLNPLSAWVSTSLASDHRMVVVEIEVNSP